jgi:hypothetical protein
VVATRVYQGEILELYMDRTQGLSLMYLQVKKALLASTHDSIIIRWMPNLNSGVEYLVFAVNQQHIRATHLDCD